MGPDGIGPAARSSQPSDKKKKNSQSISKNRAAFECIPRPKDEGVSLRRARREPYRFGRYFLALRVDNRDTSKCVRDDDNKCPGGRGEWKNKNRFDRRLSFIFRDVATRDIALLRFLRDGRGRGGAGGRRKKPGFLYRCG